MNYLPNLEHQQQMTSQARVEMLRLAQSQRDNLANSFGELIGDGGPTDETADEMLQAIRKWRDADS
jgi:hypothetical protein